MRIRSLILAVLTLVSVAACSSSKKTTATSTTPAGSTSVSSSAPVPTGTFDASTCAQLAAAGQQLANLGGQIQDASKRDAALTQLAAGLTQLRNSAPAEVKDPLGAMIEAVLTYKEAVAGKTAPDPTALSNMMATLQTEGAKVSAYVVQKCPQNS